MNFRQLFVAGLELATPWFIIALLALLAYGAVVARRRGAPRLARGLEVARGFVGILVRAYEQTVAAALRDPNKPGTWTQAIGAALKAQVIADAKALYPHVVRALVDAGARGERLDVALGHLVEAEVLSMKEGRSSVPPRVEILPPPLPPRDSDATPPATPAALARASGVPDWTPGDLVPGGTDPSSEGPTPDEVAESEAALVGAGVALGAPTKASDR
jgi:hypothetical protein